MSGRPFDPLYDTTYVTSSARDHYRQQTVAGGFMVERAPEYSNMFSKLPHYPSTTFRLKNSDRVPAFVDRTFQPSFPNPSELAAASRPEVVAGTDRYKYFRRPLLSMPTHSMYKEATVLPPPAPPLPPPEPKAKTVGTQSDYRESEAQTTPWEPMAVMPEVLSAKQQHLLEKHHCLERAELAYLKDLKFGDGLPPGMHEVWRIEKMRAKRAFEATLPPLDDVEQLPRRQRMIEEWESEEWREREEEIHGVHDERLDLLEQALLVREEELDETAMRQVEARKAQLLQQKSSKFAEIQANRIKTMRQLVEARKYVEKPRKLHKQTIVERYANFGSTAYAPVQREGRFPEAKPQGKTIETEGYQPVSLPGVLELENYLPARLLNPKIADLTKPTKMDYKQRQEAAIQKDLKAINDLLDTAKATKGRGIGECWPAPLKSSDLGLTMLPGGRAAAAAATLRAAHQANAKATAPKAKAGIRGTLERPEATELPPPMQHGPEGARNSAAILLQRLLRGRAVQNVLFEGKTRRLELIQELRLAGSPQAATTRPEDTPGVAHELDAMLGVVVSRLATAMALEDPESRAAAIRALLRPESQHVPPDFDAPVGAAAAQQHLRFSIGGEASGGGAGGSSEAGAAGRDSKKSRGVVWLKHMQASMRGEVPPPEEVAAEAAGAGGRRPDAGDETPHNFELLMQAMAGLTGGSARGTQEEAQPPAPPPPTKFEEEDAGGREARVAAAAAAEARLQAALASRPGQEANAEEQQMQDAEAGKGDPQGSTEEAHGDDQLHQQGEEQEEGVQVHGGDDEARQEQQEEQQQAEERLESGRPGDADLEAKIVKIQALQRRREAQKRVERIRRERQQEQEQQGQPEQQEQPRQQECQQGEGGESEGELEQEPAAAAPESKPAEQVEGVAAEGSGGEEGEDEGVVDIRDDQPEEGGNAGQEPSEPPAAEAQCADEPGSGLPEDEGAADRVEESGQQEVAGEEQHGSNAEKQEEEGDALQHSEELQGEPSFGGQAGQEEQADVQGPTTEKTGEEHSGDVTLYPHQQQEEQQEEPLGTEPSLGPTGEPRENRQNVV